jgi:hypothetical protein
MQDKYKEKVKDLEGTIANQKTYMTKLEHTLAATAKGGANAGHVKPGEDNLELRR